VVPIWEDRDEKDDMKLYREQQDFQALENRQEERQEYERRQEERQLKLEETNRYFTCW